MILAGGARFETGPLRAGETKIVKIPSGEPLEVRFTASRPRVWRSDDAVAPGASIVIYIRTDESVQLGERMREAR